MKNKLIIILSIVLLSIIFSIAGTYLYRSMTSTKAAPANEKALKSLKDSLELSEAQYCRIKECQECFKDDLSALSCEIHQNRFELIKQLRENSQDINKIESIMDKIDSLQSRQLHKIVDNILDQKNILDDSQKEKFFQMLLSQIMNEKKSCMKKHKHSH